MTCFRSAGLAIAGLLCAQNASAVQTMPSEPVITAVPLPTSSPSIQVAIVEPPPPQDPQPSSGAPNTVTEPPATGNANPQIYGHAGVLELGGFVNFTGASGFTSIQVSPTAGVFIFDRLELTGILGFNYVYQSFDVNGAEVSNHKTIVRVLVEPSYHVALGRNLWGFFGLGVGGASVPVGNDRSSVGFDVAPRIGANFLIGRSGLLSPALFIDYTTAQSLQSNGTSMLGVNTNYGMQAGYTVLW